MSYLDEFRKKIGRDDYPGFLILWEEYCAGDEVDAGEIIALLEEIRKSRFNTKFGGYVETALPLWEKIQDEDQKFGLLRLVLDLQTTNSQELADIAQKALALRFPNDAYSNEKLRLVGLRGRTHFKGAIRNYELLTHLSPSRFVYHSGGWGTGEVVSLSLVREELVIEFECVSGRKNISFENAFHNLIPISDDHFLSKRFGDPDALEALARQDSTAVLHMLLRDLGPKTAAEIKEELCDLVIPASEWTKWWQSARSKLKKDPLVEMPEALKEPFRLRSEQMEVSERLKEALAGKDKPSEIVLVIYNFLRDFPELQKVDAAREFVKIKLGELTATALPNSLALEVRILQHDLAGADGIDPKEISGDADRLLELLQGVEIVALKKRLLVAIREGRADWDHLFLTLFKTATQTGLREYLLQELSHDKDSGLVQYLAELIGSPILQPQLFVWYFQKVMKRESGLIKEDPKGAQGLFEAILLCLHEIEPLEEYRELTKRIYLIVTGERYALVREILKESSIEFAREMLLLVSKCHTFSEQDVKILQSLAEVVHPSLGANKESQDKTESETIWTSESGYHKVVHRLQELATTETVDVAKEIEKARELGDLRENSEYKFALEKRSRIQAEIRTLSEQVKKARIITAADIPQGTVGVGSVVDLKNEKGDKVRYTLLGPWDADPDNGVLSIQSRLAEEMVGLKKGEGFEFKGERFTVASVEPYLKS